MIAELLFRPKIGASTLANPSRWMLDAFGVRPSASGVTVNESTALTISAVYCAVKLISDAVGGLPLQIYLRDDDGKELADDHASYKLLHRRPNPETTPSRFKRFMVGCELLWGNGYAEIQRNGRDEPVNVWPIHPSRVCLRRDEAGTLYYEVRNDDGSAVRIEQENMLHIFGYTWDGIQGISVIRMARDSLGLTKAAENYGNRFFANNAQPSGLLKTINQMSDTAQANLRSSWKQMYGGENAGGVAILEEGLEYMPIGMPHEDAQFLQTREFQVVEICRWFTTTPHKLKDMTHAHYANIESTKIEYGEEAIMPRCIDWEEECDRKLLSDADQNEGYFYEFNMDGLLRADINTRYTTYGTGRQWGILSTNDIRRRENMNPVGPEGDILLAPSNMIPLDQLAEKVQADIEKASQPPPAPQPPSGPDTGNGPPQQGGADDATANSEIQQAITDAHRGIFADTLRRKANEANIKLSRAPKNELLASAWTGRTSAKLAVSLSDAMLPVALAYARAICATDRKDPAEEAVSRAIALLVSEHANGEPADADEWMKRTRNAALGETP